MASYFNISGALTQELLAAGAGEKVSSVQLTNTHASDSVTVDLYIEKKLTGTFYLLKAVEIPKGVALVHDKLGFSNNNEQFGLYIKLGAADSTVDVITS